MTQADYIEITIPVLPPGANRTYQPIRRGDKPGLILTNEVRRWDSDAALIVGSVAGQFEFEPDPTADYEIVIRWWGGHHDADAHLKLVQDCVTRKLGFDDRQIKTCIIQRLEAWGEDEPPEGVKVYLFRAIEQDWVTHLLLKRLEVTSNL